VIEGITPWVPVNPPGEAVEISREQLWQGLIWKAEFPTLFIKPVISSGVLERFDDGILRDAVHILDAERTELIRERVFYEPPDRMVFLRLGGTVPGQVVNELRGDAEDGLALRFGWTLALAGVEHDSPEEAEHAERSNENFLKAVNGTIATIREATRSGQDPTSGLDPVRVERARPTASGS
jgi:Domain of unknown function (DUF1857)